MQRVVRRLDAGPVLAAERVAIGPEEKAGELMDRLAGIGARLTGFFPFDGGKWNLQPGLGLRGLEVLAEELEVADVRLRLERVFDRRHGGGTIREAGQGVVAGLMVDHTSEHNALKYRAEITKALKL